MRFCYGFVIGAVLGALAFGDARLSVWTAWAGVWAGCIGGSVGPQGVPDWRSWRRRRIDRPGREVTSSAGAAVGEWIRGEVRRTGISDWRSGGGGTVLTEPVLVSWTTGYSRFETTIYDQHGNLLAATTTSASAWQSLRASSWQSFGGGEAKYVDARGMELLTLLTSGTGKRWELSAVGGDGIGLGIVSLANHSITSDGEVVGWVRRMGPRGLRWARRRFVIQDAQKVLVGHVTRTRSSGLWSTCNVTEFGQQVPAAVRSLALAIDEAVTVWLAPKWGGG